MRDGGGKPDSTRLGTRINRCEAHSSIHPLYPTPSKVRSVLASIMGGKCSVIQCALALSEICGDCECE